MQVKRNTVCYLSQMGHNNFIYPKRSSRAIIRDDCDVERLSLITGGEQLTPIRIKRSHLMINKASERDLRDEDHTIVWLDK
jgi:hypothetical protein|tara:strand:+ start:481 stop:723 length:243 start_codon:yes stop_codon:yes gene_type:complete